MCDELGLVKSIAGCHQYRNGSECYIYKSFQVKKRMGPKTEAWGTPEVTCGVGSKETQ